MQRLFALRRAVDGIDASRPRKRGTGPSPVTVPLFVSGVAPRGPVSPNTGPHPFRDLLMAMFALWFLAVETLSRRAHIRDGEANYGPI